MSQNLTLFSPIVGIGDSTGTVISTSPDQISRIIVALADVRCVNVEQMKAEIASNGGDSKVTSKEAAAVAAMLEEEWGHEFFHPCDFSTEKTRSSSRFSPNGCMDPAEDTTIGGIVSVIRTRTLIGNSF